MGLHTLAAFEDGILQNVYPSMPIQESEKPLQLTTGMNTLGAVDCGHIRSLFSQQAGSRQCKKMAKLVSRQA